jgi:S1-C subfamily serine protease
LQVRDRQWGESTSSAATEGADCHEQQLRYVDPADMGRPAISAPLPPPPPLGRRFRRSIAVAIVAAAIGAGSTFFGLRHAAGPAGGTVLTTAEVVARVAPGLVDIVTTVDYGQAEAAGTGLVLTPSGEVVTNNHVIEGATSIGATDVGNGMTYHARVVGYDRGLDIAVLKLMGASGLQTVRLGDSSNAAAGQRVVALGNAGGRGGRPSVVTGQIVGLDASITASDPSARTQEQLTGLIKHNAAIEPGDSGGPLVNTAGDVIGIDTAASAQDFQFSGGTGPTEGFAIPIGQAKSIAGQIEAGRQSTSVHIGATGFLGVQVTSDSGNPELGVPARPGALIYGLLSGGPAEMAGLRAGNLITSVDSRPVSSPLTLQIALQRHHPGDRVSIGWTDQSGGTRTATVQLSSGPAG